MQAQKNPRQRHAGGRAPQGAARPAASAPGRGAPNWRRVLLDATAGAQPDADLAAGLARPRRRGLPRKD
ncbi:hypothetical protein [Rugamonas rubra]|uniref:Uncharacterized protein n=1 Tax=Rugamonas rubra TaxID=758825 RepID=A0A1I4M4V2_9BURK|nr:hypothetical protein [Rugamonas rubra]SFL98239.1 hypothetical protein SAMN02982985_02244 [Rugamonas rubra]